MADRSESFYTVEPVFKCVSKEECMQFVERYPRPLEKDVCGIGKPPMTTYNDFELANRWPYSVVAKYFAGDEKSYQVLINYGDCFASKTGYTASNEA